MYHFSEYETFGTGIHTPEGDELMVFCKKERSDDIIQGIRLFISEPYYLKGYSELEKIPIAKSNDKSYTGRRSNFWWCIDINPCGDWMAFLKPQSELFAAVIKNEHQEWWQTKSPEEREQEYKKSLRW